MNEHRDLKAGKQKSRKSVSDRPRRETRPKATSLETMIQIFSDPTFYSGRGTPRHKPIIN